jgi:cyanophycin synthetase
LGYDYCDVAVVTNVAADHLGMKDVNTLEDLARVKAVVPRSVSPKGFAVLNAEDKNVYAMRKHVEGTIVLFSMNEDNENIQEHARRGGTSCVYENGYITILKGRWKVRVEKAINIPLTYGGRAEFMIQNVLAATLACFVHGISLEDIRVGLTTFTPSTAQTPGRMNFVEIKDFTVLLDFAHNPAGLSGLKNFIDKLPHETKTGVLCGTGDRRDEDLREMGRISAATFDRLIIRRGDHLRGRTEENMRDLLLEGVREIRPDFPVEYISESSEAINSALGNAGKGELVVILGDTVSKDLELVNHYREKSARANGA